MSASSVQKVRVKTKINKTRKGGRGGQKILDTQCVNHIHGL